jgi:hypothetical protein
MSFEILGILGALVRLQPFAVLGVVGATTLSVSFPLFGRHAVSSEVAPEAGARRVALGEPLNLYAAFCASRRSLFLA